MYQSRATQVELPEWGRDPGPLEWEPILDPGHVFINLKYLRTLEVLLNNFVNVVYNRSVFNLLFRDQNNPIILSLFLSVENDNGFAPNIWALELYGAIIMYS